MVWSSKTFEVPDDMHDEDDIAEYAYEAPGEWLPEDSSFKGLELEEL
jgi:hypothetical protein